MKKHLLRLGVNYELLFDVKEILVTVAYSGKAMDTNETRDIGCGIHILENWNTYGHISLIKFCLHILQFFNECLLHHVYQMPLFISGLSELLVN